MARIVRSALILPERMWAKTISGMKGAVSYLENAQNWRTHLRVGLDDVEVASRRHSVVWVNEVIAELKEQWEILPFVLPLEGFD